MGMEKAEQGLSSEMLEKLLEEFDDERYIPNQGQYQELMKCISSAINHSPKVQKTLHQLVERITVQGLFGNCREGIVIMVLMLCVGYEAARRVQFNELMALCLKDQGQGQDQEN